MKCPKILSLLLMILLLSTGYASAAPSQTLKIAAGDPEDSEMGVVGNAFKEYIEEKTKGDVEIQCFYSGSLGDESECLRNVQKGTLPMAMAGIANLVPFEKKLGLLTLPYLFSNIDEVVTGTNSAPAELLNSYATKSGFRILTWTYTDFRYISNAKRPITKMADMQGLKFRVP
ncbi:TRAP transporter substrate-binding protein, partial [Bilophila wadsworthia]